MPPVRRAQELLGAAVRGFEPARRHGADALDGVAMMPFGLRRACGQRR